MIRRDQLVGIKVLRARNQETTGQEIQKLAAFISLNDNTEMSILTAS